MKNENSPWTTVAESLVRYEPSGTYYSYFRTNGKPPVKKSLKTTDFATAKRRLAERKAQAEKPVAAGIKLLAMIEKHEASVSHKAESTQTRTKCLCKKLSTHFGDVPLHELKFSELKAFLNLRIAEGGAKSSYNEDLRELKELLESAVKDKYLLENPLKEEKGLKRDKPLRDTPSKEEFEVILESVAGKAENRDAVDSYNFLKFMARAGVGNSEAANLKWKHIDFEKNQMRLYRNKTDTGYLVPIYSSIKDFITALYEGLFVTFRGKTTV